MSDVTQLAILGAFSLLGASLNIATITIIARGRNFGRGMKLQLMNLAVADLMSSLILPGSSVVKGISSLSSVIDYGILCRMQSYLVSVIFFSSLLFNTIISLERFVAVYFPLKMLNYRRVYATGLIVIAWLCSLALNSSVLLDFDPEVYSPELADNEVVCMAVNTLLVGKQHTVWLATFAIRCLVPSITILVAYRAICVKLVRRKQVGEKHQYYNNAISKQVSKVSKGDKISGSKTFDVG